MAGGPALGVFPRRQLMQFKTMDGLSARTRLPRRVQRGECPNAEAAESVS